jgi:hypothetical protein
MICAAISTIDTVLSRSYPAFGAFRRSRWVRNWRRHDGSPAEAAGREDITQGHNKPRSEQLVRIFLALGAAVIGAPKARTT